MDFVNYNVSIFILGLKKKKSTILMNDVDNGGDYACVG